MTVCKNRRGSVLLMVAAIMAFVLIITVNIMHNVTLIQDIALDRVEIQRQMRAMDALMKYAECCAKKIEFPVLDKDDEKVQESSGAQDYALAPWPTTDSLYEAKLHLDYTLDGCTLHGTLSKKGVVLRDVVRKVTFVRKKREKPQESIIAIE